MHDMNRFTAVLTASVLGTYLIVALGTTTAATGTATIAAGHYVLAAGVWGLLLAVTVLAIRQQRDRLVRIGALTVLLAYPVQALIGMVGLFETSVFTAELHLFGGIAVFSMILLTLVWHLDREIAPTAGSHLELPNEQAAPTGGTAESAGREGQGERFAAKTELATDEVVSGEPGEMVASGESGEEEGPQSHREWIQTRAMAYVSLTKPRLMWLLCLLALGGMTLATITGAPLDGVTVVATLAGGVLAIGASATFNHVYERDRDSKMDRTAERPVATETVGPIRALVFGAVLFAASMGALLAFVNELAALLTAVAAVYYAIVYTVLLKPSTMYNTVLGGGAGALPAVIGWVAVTGSIGIPAVLLAAVVFAWTPAHFYNLAIVYREDYDAAGYPMLPVVRGIDETRRRIVYWLGTTLIITAVLGGVAGFGYLYVATVTGVGGVFLWSVVEQYRIDTPGAAYRSFHASNTYLGVVLVAILVETVLI